MTFYKDIIKLESIGSTNSYASQLLQTSDVKDFTIVYTLNQTHGRGQINNIWESESGKNLTCSFILRPEFIPIENHFYLSQMFSLAIIEVLKRYIKIVSIKWPNDIYVGNKKIAGILIENSLMKSTIMSSVLGLGLNINQSKFVSNAPNPTSMCIESVTIYNINEILNEIIASVHKWYEILRNADFKTIAEAYKKNLFRYQQIAQYRENNITYNGKIIDVMPSGKLIIEKESGETVSYNFKEVEFIL